jgi:PAS domain S-box-containing protein
MIEHLLRQRDYLLDISRALTSQLSLREVLSRILRSATEMLGGQAGLIALAEGETFTVRASYGIQAALLHLFAPLLTDIPRGDPDSFVIPELNRKMQLVAQAAGMGLHQVIALPMAIAAELVGVIYIFRAYGGSFTRNDVSLLESFADQAAIAVQNARLFEQITREKQRLDAILRYSADGILILKPDHTISSINLALSRMTGWPVEESQGAPHDQVIRWARREPGPDLNEAVANGWPLDEQNVLYVEGDLRHLDGTAISVGVTYAPIFDEGGRLITIIANVRDITKFRQAEEAKTTFISVVSHELKTPVSIIKGYAGTLNRPDADWKPDVVREGLTVIEEEADRLAALIENLLDAMRLQTGTLTLHLGEVEMDRLARQLAERFGMQTGRHQIVVSFPPDFPSIQGDEQRLEQALSNLIGNAIKYSPDGGEIRIGGEALANAVRISISDQGIGIPNDQQEMIFDRFYRVDNALSRATQGAGLGLYIVRSIVEAHGGRIMVESEPSKGTTFSFALPLSQA